MGRRTSPRPRPRSRRRCECSIGPPIDREDDGEVLSTLIRLGAQERLLRPDQLGDVLQFPIDRDIWRMLAALLRRSRHAAQAGRDRRPNGRSAGVRRGGGDLRSRSDLDHPAEDPGSGDRSHPRPASANRGRRRLAGRAVPRRRSVPSAAAGSRTRIRHRSSVPSTFTSRPLAAASGGDRTGGRPRRTCAAMQLGRMRRRRTTKTRAPKNERAFNFTSGEPTTVDQQEVMASLQALADTAGDQERRRREPRRLQELPARAAGVAAAHSVLAVAAGGHHAARRDRDDGRLRSLPGANLHRVHVGHAGSVLQGIPAHRVLPDPDLRPAADPLLHVVELRVRHEVTLYTTSPFALTCPPCKPVIAPPHWVLAMAVGNTSLAAVRGTSVALQPTTNASNRGLTSGGAPFGGYIRLRFEFDNTLRTDLNVKFYRVRWRKIGSGNPFVDLTEDVWRHYAHMVGTTLMIEPYKLGPQPVGGTANLYEIPPALPPAGQWSIPDAVVDTTSAAFTSASLAPAGGGEGDYQFELTLFDAAGAAVNANALGHQLRRADHARPDVDDPDRERRRRSVSSRRADDLIYRLHVDNNPCNAALQPPDINGIDLGRSLRPAPLQSRRLGHAALERIASAPVRHVRAHGRGGARRRCRRRSPRPASSRRRRARTTIRTRSRRCSARARSPASPRPCRSYAMATDGWSRQSQYDRHAIQAFALAQAA